MWPILSGHLSLYRKFENCAFLRLKTANCMRIYTFNRPPDVRLNFGTLRDQAVFHKLRSGVSRRVLACRELACMRQATVALGYIDWERFLTVR
jgi:hypothetical protein